MKFNFGVPHSGWFEFKISDFEKEVVLIVSHTPNNCLESLAIAMNRLRVGSVLEEVEFSLEPDFALCRFTLNNESIDLEVYPNDSRVNPVKFSALTSKVTYSLYKSLRDLEACECWETPGCDKTIWSWAFPHKELDVYKTKNV